MVLIAFNQHNAQRKAMLERLVFYSGSIVYRYCQKKVTLMNGLETSCWLELCIEHKHHAMQDYELLREIVLELVLLIIKNMK